MAALVQLAVFFGWLCFGGWCLSADEEARYDAMCDGIVEAAKQAARAHSVGNMQGADRYVSLALSRFEEAKSMAPKEPQAYMHAATFLGNIHRYDEALNLWDEVVPLLPSSRRDLHQHVASQRNEINYSKISKQRDAVYSLGVGDIDAAVDLAHQQLKMYYSPRILFDLGTLETLQSERPDNSVATFERGVENFAEAQRVSVRAAAKYMSHLREAKRHAARQRDTIACPRKFSIYGGNSASDNTQGPNSVKSSGLRHVGRKMPKNSSKLGFFRYPLASMARMTRMGVARPEYGADFDLDASSDESAVHISTLKDAWLSGPQGVISKLHKCRLHVWETFESPFVEWHGNMWLAEDWKTNTSLGIYDHSLKRRFPPPGPSQYRTARRHIKGRAASLVGFSPTNYYHWLMGALPRLVVLFPTLKESSDTKLIVPRLSKNHPDDFISQTLRMVLPAAYPLEKQRIDYDVENQAPGIRLKVDTLIWADWTPVRRSNLRGHSFTHCLASPSSLIATQSHLQSIFYDGGAQGESDDSTLETSASTSFVLYVGRNSSSSRHLEGEWQLLESIRDVLDRSSSAHGNHKWELEVFDDGISGMRRAREQFLKASIIVGIHGAGLANLVFSRQHTKVIEIGFQSPAAEHYRHAALAMNMEYRWIPLESDVHAMAKKEVTLAGGPGQIIELIESAVFESDGEL